MKINNFNYIKMNHYETKNNHVQSSESFIIGSKPLNKPEHFSNKNIPLYDALPGIEKNIKRIELVSNETPIEIMKNLQRTTGSQANLFIKRDDLTNPIYGGNKARKLEFTMADILLKGSKRIITGGGLGSHMTVAISAFAKQFNIPVDIVLIKQPVNEHVKSNLLLDKYFGANMEYSSNYVSFAADIAKKYAEGWSKDNKMPYVILPGDSNPLSDLGYVNAAFEMKKQIQEGKIPEPDYIFVAAGSCGTMAGLVSGLKLAGLKTKVVGVQVSDGFFTNENTVSGLANKTIEFIGKNSSINTSSIKIKENDFIMLHNYFGEGYGYSTTKAEATLDLLKKAENINLDITYTGKAMAAMLDFAKLPENSNKNIMFLNTYNSNGLSKESNSINYLDLPKEFRQFF